MSETVFDLIMANKIPSWPVWEDKDYLAFLTPFPNTLGATVVIPKANIGGNLFKLTAEQISGLVLAANKVANILEKAFEVERVGMVVDGSGVNHVHIQLYPMHGNIASLLKDHSSKRQFHSQYPGYISSIEGPKLADSELTKIQMKIKKAAKS